MPIKITCQCGQQLTAKDEFAGKRVKCPKCGGPLLIAKPKSAQSKSGAAGDGQSISDLLDDVGMRAGVNRCPGCGAELSEQAVLCVICGFDMRKGHRIKTRVGSAVEMDVEDLGDLPVHGHPSLDAAERQIARDKLEQKMLSKGAPWWMIMLAFLGVVGFAVGMISMPQEKVVQNSGYILITAGSLLSFFYTLRLLIDAFKESVLQGLLCLVPPYVFYFVFSRWDRVGGLFIFLVIGSALTAAGYGMVFFLVPFFERLADDKNKVGFDMRHWQNRPVAVFICEDPARI